MGLKKLQKHCATYCEGFDESSEWQRSPMSSSSERLEGNAYCSVVIPLGCPADVLLVSFYHTTKAKPKATHCDHLGNIREGLNTKTLKRSNFRPMIKVEACKRAKSHRVESTSQCLISTLYYNITNESKWTLIVPIWATFVRDST